MEETICEVDWDLIRVSPFQPRRHFSEKDLKELAASIEAVGLIHPPVVRKIESGNKLLYYELIAGERRWRAAKLAGWEKIKVIVSHYSDDDAARATLIENVQRVDLNPVETAEAYKRLVDVFRMKQEAIAKQVGKKRSTVANYLRLLSLPHDIQSSLSCGEITTGHAKAILSLDSDELQQVLHDLIKRKNLTVREAERESQKLTKRPKSKSLAEKKRDIHIDELEEKLQHHFGTKVSIDHRGKRGGTVAIQYYNLDDLDRLLELFFVTTGDKIE